MSLQSPQTPHQHYSLAEFLLHKLRLGLMNPGQLLQHLLACRAQGGVLVITSHEQGPQGWWAAGSVVGEGRLGGMHHNLLSEAEE